MAWSTDGTSWTAIPPGTGAGTTTFDSRDIRSITWGGPAGQEKFVAVGGLGKMAWSTNGTSWTAITPGTSSTPGDTTFGTGYIYGITWGGPAGHEKFVAVGDDGKMAWSTNGTSWTAITPGTGTGTTTFGTGDTIYGITWGGPAGHEKFIAVGLSGKMAYSTPQEDYD
jgi:hypothetical protein